MKKDLVKILQFWVRSALCVMLMTTSLTSRAGEAEYRTIPENLYQRLGVAPDATKVEIKKAYRKLSSKLHPDKNGNDPVNVEIYQAINQAYELLSDEQSRAIYDKNGLEGFMYSGLKNTWEAYKNKGEPDTTIRGSSSRSNPSRDSNWLKQLDVDRKYIAEQIVLHFRLRARGVISDEYTRKFLLWMFDSNLVDKGNTDAILKLIGDTGTREQIFSDRVWLMNDTTLLHYFANSWWFYYMHYRADLIGSVLGKFDPENPALKRIVYNFEFSLDPTGRKFYDNNRKDIVGDIIGYMLKEPAYQGTEAGKKLFRHAYSLWKTKYTTYLMHPELLTVTMLSLLDIPAWRNYSPLQEMALEVPKIVEEKKINLLKENRNYMKWDNDEDIVYRNLLEKYPEAFGVKPQVEILSLVAPAKIETKSITANTDATVKPQENLSSWPYKNNSGGSCKSKFGF